MTRFVQFIAITTTTISLVMPIVSAHAYAVVGNVAVPNRAAITNMTSSMPAEDITIYKQQVPFLDRCFKASDADVAESGYLKEPTGAKDEMQGQCDDTRSLSPTVVVLTTNSIKG